MGFGVEAVYGTAVPPTKFFPIRSETLQLMQDVIYRTNIRGVADRSGTVPGNTHVEGDVTFEVSSDVLIYFLYGGRYAMTKTGAMAPYTYTATPTHIAKPYTGAGATSNKTYTMYILRADNPRSYTGVSIGQLAFSLENGLLMCTASMMGMDESTQTLTAATFTNLPPYGPGKNSLELPSGTARGDADSWTLTINDNLTPAFRLSGIRKPSYLTWGEREITSSFEVDYDTLTDYNAFLNQTNQTMHWLSSNSPTTDSVDFLLNATAIDSYQVNLGSLGDIQRAAASLHGFYGSTDALVATIKTSESIT
jgi:hypothetical protein